MTVPAGDYSAVGIHNQFVYVSPKDGVVIAKTSAYAAYYEGNNEQESELQAWPFFRAIVKSISQPKHNLD